MKTHNCKYHLTKLYSLILILGFALALTACGKDDKTEQTVEMVAEMPEFLQSVAALTSSDGTIKAYITIDKENSGKRIEMTMDPSTGNFTATVAELSQEVHTLLIEFELSNSDTTATLAIFETSVDLTNGNRNVTYADSDFQTEGIHADFNFDIDNDDVSNLVEKRKGTDLSDKNSVPTFGTCKLNESKLNECELG